MLLMIIVERASSLSFAGYLTRSYEQVEIWELAKGNVSVLGKELRHHLRSQKNY